LRQQLDLWEGRANPWEFWPPQRGDAPRQKIVRGLLDHDNTRLLDQLKNAPNGSEVAARGYLGLAMMADMAARSPEAIEYYRRTRDHLIALRQQRPQQAPFSRALAECDAALARLTVDSDRDEAAKQLDSAQDIYRQLASENKSDPAYQIEWLEAELSAATLSGFDAGREHLERVAEIHQSLPANWPSDPDAIYRLACFLTRREPVLAPVDDQREP
jgi:hypothetical protein